MSIKTSVVDLPRQKGEEDLFAIDKYKNGLIQFVKNELIDIQIKIGRVDNHIVNEKIKLN